MQPAARLSFIVTVPCSSRKRAGACFASLFCSTILETGNVSSGHPKCHNINAQAAPRTYHCQQQVVWFDKQPNDPMTRYKERHLCIEDCRIHDIYQFSGSLHRAAASFTPTCNSTREHPISSQAQLDLSKKLTLQERASNNNALALAICRPPLPLPRPRPTTKTLSVASSIPIVNTHCRSSSNTTPLNPSLVSSKITFYAQHGPIKQRRRCLNQLIHQSKNTS